ncbi:MAG: RluA family pseudouridine synthase [Clostridiales bacterium]|nr:RluA family pseudouridine synthase [Clostridiales bacterium]
MKRTLEYKITGNYNDAMVQDVLRRELRISTALIKELKKYPDGILINGEHMRTVDPVHTGDILTVNIYDTDSESIEPHYIPLDIMHEDEDILIINKQPGIPTHPSKGHFTDTIANGVMYHYNKNGEHHMFRAVNRLDSGTSGVMCIAKNSYAHARLAEELGTHELRRRYLAIAEGTTEDRGTIDAPIARVDFIKRAVAPEGQRAVTHYRTIECFGNYTLVELILETGRTHQIRVHMSHIGHPLLGDWLYGKEDKELFPRQALHSSYLSLLHPVTGEKMEFIPRLAKDMESFIKSL